MRITLLSPAFPPEITGAGNLYYELACALVGAGHQVTAIAARPRQRLGDQGLPERYRGRLLIREVIDGIRVIRPATLPISLRHPIGKGLDHFSVAASYALAGLVAGPSDVVMAYSPPLPLGVAGWLLARRSRGAFVLNVQDIFPQYAIDVGVLKNRQLISLFQRMERFLYARADRIAVHSEGNRDYLLARGLPPERVVSIPNWADLEHLTPAPRDDGFRAELGLGDQLVVTYAGTLGWAQDLDVVMNAAVRLRHDASILFLIAGDGPRRQELLARVAAERIDNVRFLSLQEPARYVRLLRASDVCLITLNARLTTPVVPGKLADILACGRPVVGAVPPDGDAARMVRDSGAGVCVCPGDADELSTTLHALSRDRERLSAMASKGRPYAELHCSREISTRSYERLLTAVAHATRPGGHQAAPLERTMTARRDEQT